jgi:hypothetical protein
MHPARFSKNGAMRQVVRSLPDLKEPEEARLHLKAELDSIRKGASQATNRQPERFATYAASLLKEKVEKRQICSCQGAPHVHVRATQLARRGGRAQHLLRDGLGEVPAALRRDPSRLGHRATSLEPLRPCGGADRKPT